MWQNRIYGWLDGITPCIAIPTAVSKKRATVFHCPNRCRFEKSGCWMAESGWGHLKGSICLIVLTLGFILIPFLMIPTYILKTFPILYSAVMTKSGSGTTA